MKNIVAIEQNLNNEISYFVRQNNKVTEFTEPLQTWCISAVPRITNCPSKVVNLQGENKLKYLHKFIHNKWEAPYNISFKFSHNVDQHMALQNIRLFDGMKYEDVTKLAFDIETTGLNPYVDELLMVAVYVDDTKLAITGTEEDIINELTDIIQMFDPDILVGHNIFNFDIPFLEKRAQFLGLALHWGRNLTPVWMNNVTQFRVGSSTTPVKNYRCYGRTFVDTYWQIQRYDSNTQGKLESYSLKYLEKYFGLVDDDRPMVDTKNIVDEWETDKDQVIHYALQDAKSTSELMDLIVQSEFYLTTMIPDTFQDILLSGSASKINMLLITEYIQSGYSVPLPPTDEASYVGGFVELRRAGLFENVAKIDVASLYPSIMLNEKIAPEVDDLGIFLTHLKSLTSKRLELKQLAQTCEEHLKPYYQGLEKAYKIIINSFYGYMGTPGMNFTDFNQASRVTEIGRELISSIADQIEDLGHKVIEVDTDGVFYSYQGDPDVIPYLDIPDWVKLELEGDYEQFLSIAAKNYAVKVGDKIEFHGNSLRSRRDEQFAKDFINDLVHCIFTNGLDTVDNILDVYKKYQNKLLYEFNVDFIARRERISPKTMESEVKANLRQAVESVGLQVGDMIYVYKSTDNLKAKEFYDNDEDKYHYITRLYNVTKRFSSLGIEFPRMYKKEFKEMVLCPK